MNSDIQKTNGPKLDRRRADEFENRVMDTLRRPLYLLSGVLFVLFILMVGGGILLDDLKDTVDNTDRLVVGATGPDAQEKQAQAIQDLLDNMDCRNQQTLQRVIASLVGERGNPQTLNAIINEQCRTLLAQLDEQELKERGLTPPTTTTTIGG